MQLVISSLGKGFHSVVNPHATDPRDQLHVVNDLQLNVLKQVLKGGSAPEGEQEAVAFSNLTARGIFSKKTGSQNKYPKSLSIWLHVTDQCPMRCTYCHVDKRDEHMHDPVLTAFGDMLVRTAKNKGLTEVTLRLAGGEPVLRLAAIKGWIDATKSRLAEYGCHLRIGMLSGLASLPTHVVDFVKQGNGISVSMDGLGDIQDRARPLVNGEGSFEKVRKNIEKLKSGGVSPYILVVISDDNVGGLVPFTKWLIEQNLGFRYSFQKGGELDRKNVADALRECYEVIEQAVLDGVYTKFGTHRLADLSTFNAQSTACGSGRNTCSVYLDGSIYMCQMEHGNKLPIGHVSNTSLDLCEILVDRVVRKNFHAQSSGCDGCHLRSNCAGGCPIDKQNAGGHNPNCGLFKEFLPKIHVIHGRQRLKGLIGNDEFSKLFPRNPAQNSVPCHLTRNHQLEIGVTA